MEVVVPLFGEAEGGASVLVFFEAQKWWRPRVLTVLLLLELAIFLEEGEEDDDESEGYEIVPKYTGSVDYQII